MRNGECGMGDSPSEAEVRWPGRLESSCWSEHTSSSRFEIMEFPRKLIYPDQSEGRRGLPKWYWWKVRVYYDDVFDQCHSAQLRPPLPSSATLLLPTSTLPGTAELSKLYRHSVSNRANVWDTQFYRTIPHGSPKNKDLLWHARFGTSLVSLMMQSFQPMIPIRKPFFHFTSIPQNLKKRKKSVHGAFIVFCTLANHPLDDHERPLSINHRSHEENLHRRPHSAVFRTSPPAMAFMTSLPRLRPRQRRTPHRIVCETTPPSKSYELGPGEIGVRFINTPSGKEVIAAASVGESLLQVGDSVGVYIPRACQSGLCGSCTCDILDANAEDGIQTVRACQTGAVIPDDGEELVVDVARMKTFKNKRDPMARFQNMDTEYVPRAAPNPPRGTWLQTRECPTCTGDGDIECDTCDGEGKDEGFPCALCAGSGMLRCAECQGTGEIKFQR